MNLNQEQLSQLLINKTGKSISGYQAVVLNSLQLGEIAETPTGHAYVGTLEITDPTEFVFSLNNGTADVTMLSVNKTASVGAPKVYKNLFFDKINGLITEDTEVIFSGYKYTLV